MLGRSTRAVTQLSVGLASLLLLSACAARAEVTNCGSSGVVVEHDDQKTALLSCAGGISGTPPTIQLKAGETAELKGSQVNLLNYSSTSANVKVNGTTLTALAAGEAQIEATPAGEGGPRCNSGGNQCAILTVVIA